MFMFLLFINRILIILTDWATRDDSWMYFVFPLISLKVFYILGYLAKVIDKVIEIYF